MKDKVIRFNGNSFDAMGWNTTTKYVTLAPFFCVNNPSILHIVGWHYSRRHSLIEYTCENSFLDWSHVSTCIPREGLKKWQTALGTSTFFSRVKVRSNQTWYKSRKKRMWCAIDCCRIVVCEGEKIDVLILKETYDESVQWRLSLRVCEAGVVVRLSDVQPDRSRRDSTFQGNLFSNGLSKNQRTRIYFM